MRTKQQESKARRGLIAGNWKMNGQRTSVDKLLDGLLAGLRDYEAADILICPPSIYIAQAQRRLAGSKLLLGGQNIHTAAQGAFTGEISAAMLKDCGCSHVIVGHSERREIFAESDAGIAAKFSQAQEHGLIPILCVGETRQQREAGETEEVVLRQLRAVLESCGALAFDDAVVAYEPVWAIGTGLTASPQQAQEVHGLIRDAVGAEDRALAEGLRILYGGSVKADNAGALFAQRDIDGALVGGASLDAKEFSSICSSLMA